MEISIFKYKVFKPLEHFGFTHSFWDIHFDTLLYTWIAMICIFFVVIVGHLFFKHRTINPFSVSIELITEFFVDLCRDSFGFFEYNWFAFIFSLFVFTLFCNSVGMLPFIHEPTQDLNTALACGIASFLYVQYQKIKVEGLFSYIKEYFHPIFILFPLNVVGELAKVASMSFRLFGNILGGGIIIMIAINSLTAFRIHFMIYTAIALPLVLIISKKTDPQKHFFINTFATFNYFIIFSIAWLSMFFGLFEAVVQAFVITMLTVTYLSLISKPKADESSSEEKEINPHNEVTFHAQPPRETI